MGKRAYYKWHPLGGTKMVKCVECVYMDEDLCLAHSAHSCEVRIKYPNMAHECADFEQAEEQEEEEEE